MRKPLLQCLALLALLLSGLTARAQAPAWQMAEASTQGLRSFSRATATATDASGNVYLAGNFYNPISMGGITLTTYSDGGFIAKWSPASHSFVWIKETGTISNIKVTGLAVAGSNVYMAGTFGGSLTIGSTTLTSAGSYDSYVAKLNDAGSTASFEWAQRVGGIGTDSIQALAVRGSSVYVGGSFDGPSCTLGSLTLGNTSPGSNDGFVAKLSDTGSTASFDWAQQVGGASNDAIRALAVSGSSVYAAGSFAGPAISFGSSSLSNAAPATSEGFVTKLNDAGSSSSFVWAQGLGGPGIDNATALAVAGTNVYVAGTFERNASFGSASLSSAGMGDAFVAKLSDAGTSATFAWAQSAGGPHSDYAKALAVRGTTLFLGGDFESYTAHFGLTTLAHNGGPELFVAQLSDLGSTGIFSWAQQALSMGLESTTALSLGVDRLYVVGYIEPATEFGSISIPYYRGGTVAFLASLPAPTLTATRAAQGSLALALAPNPAHSTATVQLPAVPGAPQVLLTLTDALGRVVRRHTLPLPAAGLQHELNLSGLAPGIYALRAQAGGAYALHRLVVE
jgi:hypothetical protein